jgi:4-hydroxy-tetrahydrodipicolinate synthase
LPPFYYKDVSDEGMLAFVEAIIGATKDRPIPIYLYHFPALSGVPWHFALITRLLARFRNRIVGLKDSSGDLAFAYAAADLAPGFAVFPSNEATLDVARRDAFAGCISATANLNADLCARAYGRGDADALTAAVAIRSFFAGKPLIPGIKALLAHIHRDPAWAHTMPPLSPFPSSDSAEAIALYESVRAGATA